MSNDLAPAIDWNCVEEDEPRIPPTAEEVRARQGKYPELPELSRNLALLLCLFDNGELHEAVVRQTIKGACWWASNGLGKYNECPLWSRRAASLRVPGAFATGAKLSHEHVVPRKQIEDLIFNTTPRDAGSIEKFLELSFVCIVCEDDNKDLRSRKLSSQMPSGWTFDVAKVWARYIDAKIEVIDTRTSRGVEFSDFRPNDHRKTLEGRSVVRHSRASKS